MYSLFLNWYESNFKGIGWISYFKIKLEMFSPHWGINCVLLGAVNSSFLQAKVKTVHN